MCIDKLRNDAPATQNHSDNIQRKIQNIYRIQQGNASRLVATTVIVKYESADIILLVNIFC